MNDFEKQRRLLTDAMAINSFMQRVTSMKQFINVKAFFMMIYNLVINHPGEFHETSKFEF